MQIQHRRPLIRLLGGSPKDAWVQVLTALAATYGWRVGAGDASTVKGEAEAAAVILSRTAGHDASHRPLVPTLRILRCDSSSTQAVRFSASSQAPMPFRGRTITANVAVPTGEPLLTGEVVANTEGLPIWTTSRTGPRHDQCWVPASWIGSGDGAHHHLNAERFMNLLPVVEWLRAISDWPTWQHPPLRACFMFDDPNLHFSSYGYVRYKHLAEEGDRCGYHTAFATVPLDCYHAGREAVRTLRENPGTLSLLVHGNNHTKRELAARADPPQHYALMRQADRRIAAFEHKTGLTVARVMAPPHGVCSAEMMAAMRQAGFEAVCVSPGSVAAGNPGASWLPGLGAAAGATIGGLHVIPRFALDGRLQNHALVAAYLRQPLIAVGHHWDLARGSEVLAEAAAFINTLGDVTWTNLSAIARSNFSQRREDRTLYVRTHSAITRVPVPAGVGYIALETPGLSPEETDIAARIATPVGNLRRLDRQAFAVTPGTEIEFSVRAHPPAEEPNPPLPRTAVAVLARRLLTEARDRSMPFLRLPAVK